MNETIANLIYRSAAVFRREATFRYLQEYERPGLRSPAEIIEYQNIAISNLFRFISKKIPFYRDGQFSSFESLPVISKAMLKENAARFMSGAPAGGVTVKITSGSTSEPLKVYKDREAMAREQAATYRSYGWAGIRPGARQARFWGVPLQRGDAWKHKVRDFLLNRSRYSAFRYNERTFEKYLARMRRQSPSYIYGYTSVIHDFARYLIDSKLDGRPLPELRAVIPTAEILTDSMRSDMERAYGVKVFDEYGCAEVGSIAHDCEQGRLHINSENLYVEILTDSGEIVSKGEGRFLLTELHNRIEPLVRYDSGDYGILTKKTCPCGRPQQLLENVHGRAYDTVIGPGGAKYNAAFFSYIFKEVQHEGEAIRQFQVIQNDQEITFRIVRGRDFEPGVEETLNRLLADEFGDHFSTRFEYVDFIERERSGKLRQLKRISPIDPEMKEH